MKLCDLKMERKQRLKIGKNWRTKKRLVDMGITAGEI